MERPLPVLMLQSDIICLKEAVHRTGRNERTVRRWCVEDGIGRRTSLGAPWEISAPALEAKRYGDAVALEMLRAGERGAPEVRRYLEFLGLPG